ncbi:MAG: lysophospholipid acyltransferase family protein, partial [Acidimicrobiales bacterium]
PFILSPVHRSNIDTPLVAAVTRRRLRFMGKAEVWTYRPVAWSLTALGGFPVRRGSADREAMRTCEAVLAGGEPLVLFPEGTRREGLVVADLHRGAAWLAARAQVPIVPVGIGGSARAMPKGSRMLRPVRVHLEIGPALVPPAPGPGARVARRDVEDFDARLRAELQRLFDVARQAVGEP